jgi:hypothetical protein
MGSMGPEPNGRTRRLVRVLVLSAVIGIAILLTRCPLADSPDGPLPAPRPRVL